ncbi:MAG TPA: hypothetical protein VG146_05225 [Verrucomicrobiae bacterium]|nr:hypothetical protein [Verrucomicrobiae bacterium]
MKKQFTSCVAALTSILLTHTAALAAVTYYGNLYDGNGGGDVVSGGTLTLSDNSTRVSAVLNKTSLTFNYNVVLYIDSLPGGFANTSSFADSQSPARSAISMCSNFGSRSSALFAPGFLADYAIALSPYDGRGELYKLAAGGPGSLQLVGSVNFNPQWDTGSARYTFNFYWSDIGQQPASGNGFRFQSAYITDQGRTTFESYESISGTAGYGNTLVFNNYNVYGIEPVPEPSNAALLVFGGIVAGAGTLSRLAQWKRGA